MGGNHKHPSPSPAVARLSPKERLRLPNLYGIFKTNKNVSATSPLPWGEEQGEGVRWLLCALFAVLLTACGQAESEAQITPVVELPNNAKQSIENEKSEVITLKHVRILKNPKISCQGVFEQGGAVQCNTYPNATVEIGGLKTKSNQDGFVLLGFDRDAPTQEKIVVSYGDNTAFGKTFEITPREYAISRIDGLPPSQVSTFSEAQLVRIRASSARKKTGFASREKTLWFKDGFDYPLKELNKTSPFGAQRILNGVTKKPHYGVDIAAPVGTPIYAPADGVVSMADDDLYFEGAMILLDHGQGLISMYLHVSAIDVKPGQTVKRGEKIGEVGSKGRSTGPHLCWRLKWRNRHLDPELLTKWPTEEHTHD